MLLTVISVLVLVLQVSTLPSSTSSLATTSEQYAAVKSQFLPDRQNCGFQDVNETSNGLDTDPKEFPWTALILHQYSREKIIFGCIGSLISSRYVLTAPICITSFVGVFGPIEKVRLGDWNISSTVDCQKNAGSLQCQQDGAIEVGVAKLIPHKDFIEDSSNDYYNIGLIKLQDAVKYTPYIRPICLPSYDDNSIVENKMWIAGWIRTVLTYSSSIKQKSLIPVMDKLKCEKKFHIPFVKMLESQLCGGEQKMYSWQGDYGGPLMTTAANNSEQWILRGLYAVGIQVNGIITPGIYTNVSLFLDWIDQNIDS